LSSTTSADYVFQEDGLAAAGTADDDEGLGLVNGKAYAVEDAGVAERFVNVVRDYYLAMV